VAIAHVSVHFAPARRLRPDWQQHSHVWLGLTAFCGELTGKQRKQNIMHFSSLIR
jgi:hypothetical protein